MLLAVHAARGLIQATAMVEHVLHDGSKQLRLRLLTRQLSTDDFVNVHHRAQTVFGEKSPQIVAVWEAYARKKCQFITLVNLQYTNRPNKRQISPLFAHTDLEMVSHMFTHTRTNT